MRIRVNHGGAFRIDLRVTLFLACLDPVGELRAQDRVQHVMDPPTGHVQLVFLVRKIVLHALVGKEPGLDFLEADVVVLWYLNELDVGRRNS